MMGATLSLMDAALLKGAIAVALVWVMQPVQGLRVSVLIAMLKGANEVVRLLTSEIDTKARQWLCLYSEVDGCRQGC
jgi:hypothetical protein